MRRLAAVLCLGSCLLVPAFAGSVGMFAGKVVEAAAEKPPGKWIYISGRGGTVRRVEISKARYSYSDEVPQATRSSKPADDLRDGAVIQVAAEQDGSGEWIAQSILFLRLSKQKLVRSSTR